MLFPEEESSKATQTRTVFLYQNGKPDQKPAQLQLLKKKSSFKDIAKSMKLSTIRVFNSEGAQYFEEDLDFIKHESVLYVSRGQQFDPASCFAEYSLLKLLGEGGFGKVYLAKHRQTDQKFAIKIIKTQNIGSVSDIDSIFVEAEILKSLRHSNIVEVHKCLTMKNMEVVIIMQYLQGGDLLKYVSALKYLQEATARTMIRQVVKGILYCHKNNLTHRDLKLENLLLLNAEEQKIKIIDFGIAGAISSMRIEQMDTGSLSYMAPECFVAQKNYRFDGKIDVWAIGVILFAMLCGELPFKGENCQQTIEAIKKGNFRISSTLQKQLSCLCLDFLEKCLQVDPRSRVSIEELDNHQWLDDGVFTNHQSSTDYLFSPGFELEKEDKIGEDVQRKDEGRREEPCSKMRDLSNRMGKKGSLEEKKRSAAGSLSSKSKTAYNPLKKPLKSEVPKSRFR